MNSRLQEAKNLLVRRWGEMGGYWGINRTMAEIHALLFVTRQPLCTDEVMDQLKISRGNASMNLRALVDWGLIQRVHHLGDRKEYFVADADVWHMFETIMRERRRREVEPIIASIDRCCELVAAPDALADGTDPQDVREFSRRLEELRHFLATMGTLFEAMLEFGPRGLDRLATLLAGAKAVTGRRSPKRDAARSRTARARG